MFKNFVIDDKLEKIIRLWDLNVPDRFFEYKKLPAAWLIEQCGLKGKKAGDAVISDKHASYILNLGKAKSSDVMELVNLVKKSIKRDFGLDIKLEVRLLGFF